MSALRLVLRSLWFYRRTHLAVLLGVAAGAAVIGGALVVGDSVRASLRQLTLSRLGAVDYALSGGRFVTEGSVASLTDPPPAPALALSASFTAGDADRTERANGVNLFAGDGRLWSLLDTAGVARPEGERVVLNARVADDLGVTAGDTVTVAVEVPAAVPRENLLGERDDAVRELPLTVSAVLPRDAGAGRFDLNPAQQLPPVAFADLTAIQELLDLSSLPRSRFVPEGRSARVNALFAAGSGSDDPERVAAELTDRVKRSLTLDDLRLRLVTDAERGTVSLESDRMILDPPLAAAARRAAETLGLAVSPVYAVLVNRAEDSDDPTKHSAYFVLAGVEPETLDASPFGPFEFDAGGWEDTGGPVGQAVPDVGAGGDLDPASRQAQPDLRPPIVLNEFLTTEQLGVTAGDAVTLRWYPPDSGADAPETVREFAVAGVVKLDGTPAADRTLTPRVKGITDAETFGDWEQPFPMDLDAVTDQDDAYWEQYRATPKAFLPMGVARDLFGSRYGDITSFRVAGRDGATAEQTAAAFERAFLAEVDPVPLGLAVLPVKARGLAAAAGTTDFAGLFLGFSLFLILSAAILVSLLFRLGVERRAGEVGLEAALGFDRRRVRRLQFAEGAVVVLAGGLLGTAAAVGYAAALLWALRTLWVGAVGTTVLELAVTPASLTIGFVASAVLAAAAVWWGLRRLGRLSARRLLAGETDPALTEAERAGRRGRAGWWAAGLAAVAAAVLTAAVLGVIPDREAFAGFGWTAVVFFAVGSLLLAASLFALAWWLDRRGGGLSSKSRLGLRNAARERTRSVLTAGLIATATFLLVAVAAARKDPTGIAPRLDSGNGGFTLVAESTAPLPADPSNPAGRETLGLDDPPPSADLFAFRVNPGQDASCLNLYRPTRPTLLGVPPGFIDRGGFAWASTTGENPWELLREELPPREVDGRPVPVIPVVGDLNTLQYSLHLGVGGELPVPAENPEYVLEVVGMLDGSVFQGVLLMDEARFLDLFPGRDGWSYFLADSGTGDAGEKYYAGVASWLETGLTGYGLDAEPVAARIGSFLAVQNTYLLTFLALGGLGLLLGTVGLAAVMLRNVLERRGELALLRAVGFRPSAVRTLVLTETAFLLTCGLAAGTASALLALAPHLLSTGADVPWLSGGLTLSAVFVAGMAASLLAVRAAVRTPIVATLRGE